MFLLVQIDTLWFMRWMIFSALLVYNNLKLNEMMKSEYDVKDKILIDVLKCEKHCENVNWAGNCT
jgi:hypothetical protein